ncbi:MAG: chemotaxis protein CheW [Armatimonadetes bacterium]|nr:chemotaxis protein CheW [Armatimonadota bacterium]
MVSHSPDENSAERPGRQYLAFQLGGDDYAVDILRVQEIRAWEKATRLPHTPDYVKGVINLRGEIVPIVDLRERFRTGVAEYGPRTVVVVFQVRAHGRQKSVGAVVDAVSDVHLLPDSCISSLPEMEIPVSHDVVAGLATLDDRMLILLDVDRLLSFETQSRNGDEP